MGRASEKTQLALFVIACFTAPSAFAADACPEARNALLVGDSQVFWSLGRPFVEKLGSGGARNLTAQGCGSAGIPFYSEPGSPAPCTADYLLRLHSEKRFPQASAHRARFCSLLRQTKAETVVVSLGSNDFAQLCTEEKSISDESKRSRLGQLREFVRQLRGEGCGLAPEQTKPKRCIWIGPPELDGKTVFPACQKRGYDILARELAGECALFVSNREVHRDPPPFLAQAREFGRGNTVCPANRSGPVAPGTQRCTDTLHYTGEQGAAWAEEANAFICAQLRKYSPLELKSPDTAEAVDRKSPIGSGKGL